jgi:uncharacterized membrane protein
MLLAIYLLVGFTTGSLLLAIATEGKASWNNYEPNFIEKSCIFFVILVLCPITITAIFFFLLSQHIHKREQLNSDESTEYTNLA